MKSKQEENELIVTLKNYQLKDEMLSNAKIRSKKQKYIKSE